MPDKTTMHPSAVDIGFSDIEEIVADIRAGKMVIMVDDENRENEGDLIMAAAKVRPEDINYMATHGRGLICLTLSRERCSQLRLPLMVSETDDHHATNFTISIEAAEGITTGISAHDRARTIQAAVAPSAKPEDLSQPGHIFPVMAQPGGVLTRAGHTEAGCDLARLAGLDPSAAIVEILNADGSMARRPDLEKFARQHGIKIGFMSFFVKAACQALKQYPDVNSAIDGEDIIYQDFCDIGVAISIDSGLIVPVIRNANALHFAEIEAAIASLAGRAKEKKLMPGELTGGTFTITNGGVFGSLLSTPIPASTM